ncbi:hypothetical protein [Pandoraea sp. XY-2]|uniref:hypothetical protein n=1 Tax=Pandoraea sp. XY-2 TaxID=2518599 RepID=UPI00101FE167|nr:hypothetical protein [Pandoraea sp. XY-2]
MNPVGAATISIVPMVPSTEHRPLDRPSERFIADLRTVGLQAAGSLRSPMAVLAVRTRDDTVQRSLPLLSVSNLVNLPEPEPAVDFAFFREPLKQNDTLLSQWGKRRAPVVNPKHGADSSMTSVPASLKAAGSNA